MADVTNGHTNGSNGYDTNGSANGSHNGEYSDDSAPSPIGDVVELADDEFPSFFIIRDGRLFHSSAAPYPLPIDTPEQDRIDLLHNMRQELHGNDYFRILTSALSPVESRERKVLDICTGKGIWVHQMSSQFPHVSFIGFDHVPLTTRYPPTNVQFDVGDDVNGPFRWTTGSFDLAHARDISLAVRDYGLVLQQVGQVLRPGGLFISSEMFHQISFPPTDLNRTLASHAQAILRFQDAVDAALLSCKNLTPNPSLIPSLLAANGGFSDISPSTHYLPIGTWQADARMQSIGQKTLSAFEIFAESIKLLLVDAGWNDTDLTELVNQYQAELRTVSGLVCALYTVHAKKV